MICKICGNVKDNKKVQIKEMMFGTRDKFDYFECYNCGCLQIANIPDNIAEYYPTDFYSFNDNFSENPIKRYLRMERNGYAFFNRGIIGRIMCRIYPPYFFNKLAKLDIGLESKILDVGCGSGRLLYSFKGLDFKNLAGIDPYTDKIVNTKELKILKKTIHDITEQFDVIILKNVLEHYPDQIATLMKISKLLEDNGISMIYDSNAFQFWGSEPYERDIPLMSENSFLINPKKKYIHI